ncbi:MAG: hypothetical protein RLZZ135_1796, partial [Cyanobacteriota bacterium]
RSGKTGALVSQFCHWLEDRVVLDKQFDRCNKILVLAGNDDSKRSLGDALSAKLAGQANYPISAKTTIGLIQDEVLLFYPLLIQKLHLPAHFPLRLRPETEQELATKLWQPALARLNWREIAPSEYRFVRRTLDLLQLAAYSCTPLESMPQLLARGFGVELDAAPIYSCVESLAAEWRDWCLARGLLTYGIMTELYWRHLLPHPEYQQHLRDRYWALLADDVDDYPAIGRQICEYLLASGVQGAFSYNPDGMVRLGLSADPDYLLGLKSRCTSKIYLESIDTPLFADRSTNSPTIDLIVRAVINPGNFLLLPSRISAIETRTRGEMLKSAAESAIEQIKSGKVQPGDIAIIAPGLDAISRYTIIDMFDRHQVPIESLNAQRPLNSDPGVRALLTLMALTYTNLGQLVSRDEIADLLVTLSPIYAEIPPNSPIEGDLGRSMIDPVRAGLLADYCYAPSLFQPRLLPYVNFPRWDRLGASVTKAYNRILAWVERVQQQQPTPLNLLNEAIGYFFHQGSYLPFDRLSALRELMETAQHYWQVAERTYSPAEYLASAHQITAQFILLLRQGTVSANPYPVGQLKPQDRAVTLSNIFQYRASKRSHPYHFWLDVGSPLWAEGGAATLYGANLFLKHYNPDRSWTEADTATNNEQRLERILRDLFHRVSDRVYLCNSDLAIDGQEQVGALLTLVHSVVKEPISV